MKVVFPTDPFQPREGTTIFLAGSIEMGNAENWQDRVAQRFSERNVTFFNPRRPDWDSSWKQTKDDPQFSYQVKWELEHLKKADLIALYLSPGTVSPISLLELGLYLNSDKLIICCPEGFARKGNVDITADEFGYTVCETFEDFITVIDDAIKWTGF